MAKKEIDARFNKFGTVSFTDVTRINDFIDFLEQGKLMGARCKTCGKKFFPPRADCFHSLDSDMDWFEVTGTGKLVSYSALKYAPSGFKDDLPYTIALVDFGEYKVFGRIDGSVSFDALKVDMDMKAVVTETKNGKLTYTFQKA
ncbi:Zn-ribbon domain-containing OB-fold protein [Desulfococcaceae bacterium HSG7]|nr:Zn-ribbon domain-containing OB-fold protein [Desulfococcaceae bacterium HSG9]MDM8553586.1 Zn-ribbon domain-containing OB-fold protein [Desulfococcaceae bacterium HSG7]